MSELAKDLRWALDPVFFFEQGLGFQADAHQRKLLRSRARRQLLNCTRKWGKSTTTAAGVVHECGYVPNSKIVIIAPSQRQSSLLLELVASFAERVAFRCTKLGGEDPGLKLCAGEVIALPGSEATVRGLQGTTWLIIDEAARVSDDLCYAVRPFLANTNGRLSLLSTPFGKRGFFYQAAESGQWDALRVPAAECPRISAEFLAEEQAVMPASWFRQEYCCEFTSTADGVFDHDMVVSSLSSEVEPLCL